MIRLARTTGCIAALSVAAAWALAGCGSSDGTAPQTTNPETAGEIGLSLNVGDGVVLDTQSYAIIGPNGFSKSGTIDLSSATKYAATLGGIPAGSGFSITLSGASRD